MLSLLKYMDVKSLCRLKTEISHVHKEKKKAAKVGLESLWK